MASHNNTEQHEPIPEVPRPENERYDPYDDDAELSDADSEEMQQWLSTAYVRGSRKPMKAPLTASLDLAISDADVEKLKVGFKPQSMDDKWEMSMEDPDERGGLSLHIIRSWLQEECYILHIVPGDGGGGAKIQGITWEGNKGGLQCGAEQAKKEAVILARGHLCCEFENLPQYRSDEFWDSSAYKKLDEE